MQEQEKALRVALVAHAGQTQRNGSPYIFHPIRVMEGVKGHQAKCVALLHDVVEDSAMTIEDLDKDFTNRIVKAVDLLTKREGQDYQEYIEAIAKNDIARRVKRSDLRDNMDISRLPEVTTKDIERLNKYKEAYEYLR